MNYKSATLPNATIVLVLGIISIINRKSFRPRIDEGTLDAILEY